MGVEPIRDHLWPHAGFEAREAHRNPDPSVVHPCGFEDEPAYASTRASPSRRVKPT